MAENTGVKLTVDTKSAEQLVATLGREFKRDSYLKLVGQRALNWINENFRKHGAEHQWKPLSPNTIAQRRLGKGKAREGRSGQPLRDSGRMAQSFVPSYGPEPSVSVGTNDKKAKWHNEGTRPYTITAKNGKALAFHVAALQSLNSGNVLKRNLLFRMSVNHPGLAKRPLIPSDRLAEKLGKDVLEAYANELTKGI